MVSEITEEWEEDAATFICNGETQTQRIRQIIRFQKSLLGSSFPSSSSSLQASSSSSYSSLSSASGNRNLLELMKGGATSLRRLFDMDPDTRLPMFSPQLERTSDSPATIERDGVTSGLESDTSGLELDGSARRFKMSKLYLEERGRRGVLYKVSKQKLFSRLQRVVKWRGWRKPGLRVGFKRFRIRICWWKQ